MCNGAVPLPEIDCHEADSAVSARPAIAALMEIFNDAQTGLEEPVRPLALIVRRSGSPDVAGGLYGVSYYGWLFIELLVLSADLRGHRIGTRLMDHAEGVARTRGCVGVWLDTFSFQARGFYEKRGYRLFGTIDDYPPGQSGFWMKKHLDA